MAFCVGQRVVCVCVNFSREPVWRGNVRLFPQLGSVYTIRSIREERDLIGLCFVEIINPPGDFGPRGFVEPAFDSRRFRPLRTTSIEVFRQLLVPASVKVKGVPTELV
jgi:hypothetical protein